MAPQTVLSGAMVEVSDLLVGQRSELLSAMVGSAFSVTVQFVVAWAKRFSKFPAASNREYNTGTLNVYTTGAVPWLAGNKAPKRATTVLALVVV